MLEGKYEVTHIARLVKEPDEFEDRPGLVHVRSFSGCRLPNQEGPGPGGPAEWKSLPATCRWHFAGYALIAPRRGARMLAPTSRPLFSDSMRKCAVLVACGVGQGTEDGGMVSKHHGRHHVLTGGLEECFPPPNSHLDMTRAAGENMEGDGVEVMVPG